MGAAGKDEDQFPASGSGERVSLGTWSWVPWPLATPLSFFGTSPALGSVYSVPSHSLSLSVTDTEATSGEGASQGSEYFPLLVGFGGPRGPGVEGGDTFIRHPYERIMWPLGHTLLWSRLWGPRVRRKL